MIFTILLRQVEERNSDEEEVRALPYVLALHAFCLVDPMLCAPATDPSKFVVTLQPYLKHQVIVLATFRCLISWLITTVLDNAHHVLDISIS